MTTQDIGNIKTVVVDKHVLLDIIKENKIKHDQLYTAAVSGYWLTAHSIIEQKRKNFENYHKELYQEFNKNTDIIIEKIINRAKIEDYRYIPMQTSFNYSIDLKYPENHAAEYNRAIRSIELNVYDKIQLSELEFNQYVMNDWSWKSAFVTANSAYILSGANCITGAYSSAIQASGCLIL